MNDRFGADDVRESAEDRSQPILALKSGCVQAINCEKLMSIAREGDLVLRLEYRAGDYVIEHSAILHVLPGERCLAAKLGAQLNDAFLCGRNPTAEQDIEFALRQMVEVAVRALSPGINDPFTAINCIDALATAVCRIAQRGLPGPLHYDAGGRLRIVTPVTTFCGLVDTAFNQIRRYGRGSAAVMIRLLEVLRACGGQMCTEDQRECLLRHAELAYEAGVAGIPQERDRDDLRQRLDDAVSAVTAPQSGGKGLRNDFNPRR